MQLINPENAGIPTTKTYIEQIRCPKWHYFEIGGSMYLFHPFWIVCSSKKFNNFVSLNFCLRNIEYHLLHIIFFLNRKIWMSKTYFHYIIFYKYIFLYEPAKSIYFTTRTIKWHWLTLQNVMWNIFKGHIISYFLNFI